MTAFNLALALLLGVGLSASTGLNTFLPLLLLSGAARFHIAGITLNQSFAWLGSDVAIVVLIIASVVEILGDKIPTVDHFLDVIGTFIRPIAGATAAASVLTHADPVVAAIAGLIIGSPISFGLHSLKAGARVVSTTTTFGCANPLISLVEDVVSVIVSIVAIFAPILVPLLLLAVVFVLWRLKRRFSAAPPAGSTP
ncbi:MAG TPA: DUF4126 domain-containing protein [Thermoanaerobaculia bacterium]|nr:DUF4126 domain-containing protein [Thermoanaerobaculia bacterium]